MDYIIVVYLNVFQRKMSTFHTLLFFDNDTQGVVVWKIIFIFMIYKKNIPSPIHTSRHFISYFMLHFMPVFCEFYAILCCFNQNFMLYFMLC